MIILARWTDTNGHCQTLQLRPGMNAGEIERAFDGVNPSTLTFTPIVIGDEIGF